ncbi:MAG: hypothetical protein GY915_05265 [bacterium]|nr:hypothetical protein [bacterium]
MATKSQALLSLQGKIKNAKILDVTSFSVKEWHLDAKSCLEAFKPKKNESDLFIVRSSAQSEDQIHVSNAGKFESLLRIFRKR